jgi:hypothetical protein
MSLCNEIQTIDILTKFLFQLWAFTSQIKSILSSLSMLSWDILVRWIGWLWGTLQWPFSHWYSASRPCTLEYWVRWWIALQFDTNNAYTYVILIPTVSAMHRPVKANTVELVNAFLRHSGSIGSLCTNPQSKNGIPMGRFAMAIITFVLSSSRSCRITKVSDDISHYNLIQTMHILTNFSFQLCSRTSQTKSILLSLSMQSRDVLVRLNLCVLT